ncbi:hypothetical protein HAX54_052795, partial [Datura stramonium]|nr:hypothetical protein [Datura stramonium]
LSIINLVPPFGCIRNEAKPIRQGGNLENCHHFPIISESYQEDTNTKVTQILLW